MDKGLLVYFSIGRHPLLAKGVTKSFREGYYQILEYMVDNCNHSPSADYKLREYYRKFGCTGEGYTGEGYAGKEGVDLSHVENIRTYLVIDINKILLDKEAVKQAIESLKKISNDQLSYELSVINTNVYIKDFGVYHDKWIKREVSELKKDYDFIAKKEKKILVTANISAGKSTLINCLIGQILLMSSQERCTSSVRYIYEKRHTASSRQTISFVDDNQCKEIRVDDKTTLNKDISTELYCDFGSPNQTNHEYRYCYIDTPGVNSATVKQHGTISKNEVRKGDYDYLVYIISRPGADEEISYLRWIVENVDTEKILFVFNKLDSYRASEDSINESVESLKEDIKKLGINDPKIYPISGYYGLLLKEDALKEDMTEDERDELEMLTAKFSRDKYDLSVYYPEEFRYKGNAENKVLASRCGIYELEQIIYGGKK